MLASTPVTEETPISPNQRRSIRVLEPKIREDQEEEEDQQRKSQQTPVQQLSWADCGDSDLNCSVKSRRPHVPYSQREIYEKKATPPVRRQVANTRRTPGGTADSCSGTPANHQPASSPAFSQTRSACSPAVSSTSTAMAGGGGGGGRSTSVSRHRAATPMRGTTATPRGTLHDSYGSSNDTKHTPVGSRDTLRHTREPSRPSAESQPTPATQQQQLHYQRAKTPARTPVSTRTAGPTHSPAPSPAAGGGADGRSKTPGRTLARTSVTPQSQGTPHAKPSPSTPSKPCSSPSATAAAPGSAAGGSPAKAAANPPPWNSSTMKAPGLAASGRPGVGTSARSASVGRPPRKALDTGTGAATAAAGATAAGRGRGSAATASPAAATATAVPARTGPMSTAARNQLPQAPTAMIAAVAAARGAFDRIGSVSSAATNDCAALRDAETASGGGAVGDATAIVKAPAAAPASDEAVAAAAVVRAKLQRPVQHLTEGGATDAGSEALSLGLIDLDGSDSVSLCGSKAPHAGVPPKGSLLVPAPSCADGSEGGAAARTAEAEQLVATMVKPPRPTMAKAATQSKSFAAAAAEARAAKTGCGCVVM